MQYSLLAPLANILSVRPPLVPSLLQAVNPVALGTIGTGKGIACICPLPRGSKDKRVTCKHINLADYDIET